MAHHEEGSLRSSNHLSSGDSLLLASTYSPDHLTANLQPANSSTLKVPTAASLILSYRTGSNDGTHKCSWFLFAALQSQTPTESHIHLDT